MTRQFEQIQLKREAYEVIATETAKNLPREAGGILLGYRESNTVVVTNALAVGSAHATTSQYVRDDILANTLLEEFLDERADDDPTGYIGEWHSHPAPQGPSHTDLGSIRAIAKTSDGPVALVVHATSDSAPFHGVVSQRQRFRSVTSASVRVVVPESRFLPLGPLPPNAVRGDGPVFISYRQTDGTEQAKRIEHLLRAAGLVVWRDYRDLRAGTTTDRLELALTQGLSAAVLVVTPDIVYSEIVRERELPRLLQLDEDPDFSLSIANTVGRPGSASKCDYEAPDRLLRLAPKRILADKKQSNMFDPESELEITRDLLMHRVEQRKSIIRTEARAFTIRTQTRPTPFALDADDEDLHIRVNSAPTGRLPGSEGLHLLRKTLPLISDAIYAARAPRIQIVGGAHLSIALALGAALPETKFGTVGAVDVRGETWSSDNDSADPMSNVILAEELVSTSEQNTGRVAVFVTLTPGADRTAFERLISASEQPFTKAFMLSSTTTRIDPLEAGRLSASIAQHIKRIAAENGRSEVHLAFHGPYTMAVLVGRHLNTVRTIIYEWDNVNVPSYVPTLALEPGSTEGPITDVMLEDRDASTLPSS
ncbi:SAVED domain-containing protein [Paenarthrobacter sp. GOM3]|uniref:SAVED domain-containing protein n=1 Tax=Paenarthrobacter sp. GOM3 TaxID=2782567 RepID=UPI001BACD90C|nr:SAVED domain-containing protein [Paenarthrobacter sp. GOM3]WOH18097.1 SAVED domain-containing protein [Paenarthrobacter sp. GOM3]